MMTIPIEELELKQRLVSLSEAARLMSISTDTLSRRYRDKFVRVSKRRLAMRLQDVLHPEAS
jgi:hypothetical protein